MASLVCVADVVALPTAVPRHVRGSAPHAVDFMQVVAPSSTDAESRPATLVASALSEVSHEVDAPAFPEHLLYAPESASVNFSWGVGSGAGSELEQARSVDIRIADAKTVEKRKRLGIE